MVWPRSPFLPQAFVLVPWEDSLLKQHAEVKYRSFIGEIDAQCSRVRAIAMGAGA